MLDDCLELRIDRKRNWFCFNMKEYTNGLLLFIPNKMIFYQYQTVILEYEDGTIKVRGIEARRHDTPVFFSNFQQEVLEIISKGNNINEVKTLVPKVKDIYHKYVQLLKEDKVPLLISLY